MIYLNNIARPQRLQIPKTGLSDGCALHLTVRSTVDLSIVLDADVRDSGKSSLYWTVRVALPAGIPDGSYEYTLTAGGLLESEGCMTVGRQDVRAVEYVQDMEFRQYGQ